MSKIKTNTLENVAGTYNVAIESLALMSNRNYFINGGFDIWQRGEDFNLDSLSQYTADRWYVRGANLTGGTTTVSRSNSRLGDKFAHHISLAHVGATTSGYMVQKVEGAALSGKTVTLSGEVYVDNVCGMVINTVVTNVGNVVSDTYTPEIKISDVGQWVKFSFTMDLFSIVDTPIEGDNYGFYLGYYGDGVDAIGTNTLRFRELQIEEGSVATPFEMLPVALTMVACQRYYQEFIAYKYMWQEEAYGMEDSERFIVDMRVQPSATKTTGTGIVGGGFSVVAKDNKSFTWQLPDTTQGTKRENGMILIFGAEL